MGSIQGALDAVNGFIDRVQKMPLIIMAFAIASHDVWRTLESDRKEERKDAMVKAANDRKDYVTDLLLKEQQRVATYQDTILAIKQREMNQLLDRLKKD